MKHGTYRWMAPFALAASLLSAPLSFAADPSSAAVTEPQFRQDEQLLLSGRDAQRLNLEVGKDYALGLTKYRLDHETEMLGWQVSNSWYFGRQRGEDSGLTLVWQQDNHQVSFSKDGLRLTKRF